MILLLECVIFIHQHLMLHMPPIENHSDMVDSSTHGM